MSIEQAEGLIRKMESKLEAELYYILGPLLRSAPEELKESVRSIFWLALSNISTAKIKALEEELEAREEAGR